ncbi:MAG: hypothetical protein ABUL67_00180 [Haliangium ochraceum]
MACAFLLGQQGALPAGGAERAGEAIDAGGEVPDGEAAGGEVPGGAAPAYTPPPPPPPPPPRRYGDRGTSEVALGLGYSSYSGFAAAGAFRYFVLPGVAPGLEASYVSGGSRFPGVGMVMGALRLAPVRAANVAVVLTGRAGRVMFADHVDGWGAGGGGGVIIFLGTGVGIELGYEALRLLPASFCATFVSCVIHGPVFGLRLAF